MNTISRPEMTDVMKKYGKSSGIERSLVSVTSELRYTWSEKDRHLMSVGLIDPNGPVSGISRGLGEVPDKVYGFAVSRDNEFIKSASGALIATRKSYCAPFHRSLIGELTKSNVLYDGDVRRFVSATRLAAFCNKRIFEDVVMDGDKLDFIITRHGKKFIGADKMKRLYGYFTRLAISPYVTLKDAWKDKNYFSCCIMCGNPAYAKCEECEVKVRKITTDTPVATLRQLFANVYEVLPNKYEQVAGYSRREVGYYLGDDVANAAVPTARALFEYQSETVF